VPAIKKAAVNNCERGRSVGVDYWFTIR